MIRFKIKFLVFGLLFGVFSCDYFPKKDVKSSQKQTATPLEMELSKLSDKLIDSPKNAFLYFQRGKLHWENSENEKALNDFYKMVTYDSTKPIYYETLAEFFVQNANVERAINSLDYAIKLDPENPKYHVMQGKYSLILKKYQDAINHLNNALKRDVFNPDAYFYKGIVYKESNQMDKAISNFTTASEQDPTWDAPYELLGDIYSDKKNDLCLKYYDNAMKANVKNTSAILQKAYYLKANGRKKEAEAIYESLVLASPQNADAIYNLGVIAYELKQYDKALKKLQICIQVDPKHALAYYLIGKTQLALGNKPLAKSAFQNARNFDSTLVEAHMELNKL
jgi:tetratricopeptide (TPR) repeat protein